MESNNNSFLMEEPVGRLIGIFGASNESACYTEFGIRAFRVYLCMVIPACVNKASFIFLQAMIRCFDNYCIGDCHCGNL